MLVSEITYSFFVSISLFLRNWYKVLVQKKEEAFYMAIHIVSHLYLNPYGVYYLSS